MFIAGDQPADPLFTIIAITAGVVLGLLGIGVVGIAWWFGRAFKGWDWDRW